MEWTPDFGSNSQMGIGGWGVIEFCVALAVLFDDEPKTNEKNVRWRVAALWRWLGAQF
jgi:hypothetical protein